MMMMMMMMIKWMRWVLRRGVLIWHRPVNSPSTTPYLNSSTHHLQPWPTNQSTCTHNTCRPNDYQHSLFHSNKINITTNSTHKYYPLIITTSSLNHSLTRSLTHSLSFIMHVRHTDHHAQSMHTSHLHKFSPQTKSTSSWMRMMSITLVWNHSTNTSCNTTNKSCIELTSDHWWIGVWLSWSSSWCCRFRWLTGHFGRNVRSGLPSGWRLGCVIRWDT